ncbi:hypothetical protein ACTUJ1_06440 [Priestia flexa]
MQQDDVLIHIQFKRFLFNKKGYVNLSEYFISLFMITLSYNKKGMVKIETPTKG